MWSISDRFAELRRVGKLLQRHLSRAWTMEKNKNQNQQGPRQEWEIDVTGIGKPQKKKSFLFYNILIFIFPFLTSQPHLPNPFKIFQVSNFGIGIVGSLNLQRCQVQFQYQPHLRHHLPPIHKPGKERRLRSTESLLKNPDLGPFMLKLREFSVGFDFDFNMIWGYVSM